jgi:hypothetical protein
MIILRKKNLILKCSVRTSALLGEKWIQFVKKKFFDLNFAKRDNSMSRWVTHLLPGQSRRIWDGWYAWNRNSFNKLNVFLIVIIQDNRCPQWFFYMFLQFCNSEKYDIIFFTTYVLCSRGSRLRLGGLEPGKICFSHRLINFFYKKKQN